MRCTMQLPRCSSQVEPALCLFVFRGNLTGNRNPSESASRLRRQWACSPISDIWLLKFVGFIFQLLINCVFYLYCYLIYSGCIGCLRWSSAEIPKKQTLMPGKEWTCQLSRATRQRTRASFCYVHIQASRRRCGLDQDLDQKLIFLPHIKKKKIPHWCALHICNYMLTSDVVKLTAMNSHYR